MFEDYINRWHLVADGDPIVTRGAQLLPVRRNGVAAMLKVATEAEEKFGGLLMAWWGGQGAAPVLAIEGDAILLERAQGQRSLTEFARNGRDEEATRIICDAVAALHAPRNKPLPELIPLPVWFRALHPAAVRYGGLFVRSAAAANVLLSSPQDVGVLHGDIHHGNILDFGPRGWLAIDPKRLYGERGFDYANLFCNPDRSIATERSIFLRRVEIVSEAARIHRTRLLQWILAWCGLSAVWMIEDGDDGGFDMTVAQFAADELKAGDR